MVEGGGSFRSTARRVREPVTTPERVAYASLVIYGSLAHVMLYSLAYGSICSGTGMGGNQVLRLCQDSTLLYALGFSLAGWALSLLVAYAVAFRRPTRILLTFVLIHAALFATNYLWNLPWFMTPVR